ALRLGQARARLLEADQLRLRVDLGQEVVAALLEAEAADLLLALARGDGDLEARVAAAALLAVAVAALGLLLGDLDGDGAVDAGQRDRPERLDALVRRSREGGLGLRGAAVGVRADA